MSCPECNDIIATIDKILDQAEKKNDPEVLYDVRQNIDAIVEWIQHSLRGVQQDRAKRDGMKCLDNLEYAFWLKDWAQKVLPSTFREKQSDYFGKKGMSVHVDVFFQKNEKGKLTKLVYFTVIFRCEQDMLSTLNVAHHVLQQYNIDNPQYNIDNPQVKKLLIKSDNAGCYSAGSAFQAEWKICKTLGITLKRHDFNEPQCGKDQCDRESAIARKLMRACVDGGNNILNANDIKSAILYKSGVPNSKVSVIEIDKSVSSTTSVKIANSQSIHSTEFSDNHMTVWHYYQIGSGKRVEYSEVEFASGVEIVSPFVSNKNANQQTMASSQRQDRAYSDLLFCTVPGCKDSFRTVEDLDDHLTDGNHTICEPLTGMDRVRSLYAQRINTNAMAHTSGIGRNLIGSGLDAQESRHALLVNSEGWALKKKRKSSRLSPKQKNLVLDCFLTGERTGKKLTAEKVASMMRSKVDERGNKMFTPEEYLTKDQVLSQFSQMCAKKKRGEKLELAQVVNERSEEPENEEEEEASDQEVEVL